MIPKFLHYCTGMSDDGAQPWSLIHYACVRSAIERIKPQQINIYCEYVPKGPWWRLTEDMVNVVPIKAPRQIFGNPLVHPAHRADVVRLEKLLEYGGIYLDTDVFVHRDFDDLLHHTTVLGREGIDIGLGNAVILAQAAAPFLRRWYGEYISFRSKGRDSFWNEHSVQLPLRLAKDFPDEVTILPSTAFFTPLWDKAGLDRIYNSTKAIPMDGVYATHLWQGNAWKDYIEDLTPGRVRASETNFHRWMRGAVSHLPANYGKPSAMELVVRGATRIVRTTRAKLRKGIQRLRRSIIERLRRIAATPM